MRQASFPLLLASLLAGALAVAGFAPLNVWPMPVLSLAVLFGLLAAVALTLSSVGLYAVMAYAVTQRTQEIGVRVAIGAQRWQVSWLFLRSGLAQLAVGLVLGLPAALTMARVTRLRLVEVEPTDPLTLAGITLLLFAVALAACLVPARRASRVDPVDALRAD